MKLQYKIQQYQTDAVNAVVDCFDGQPYSADSSFIVDHESISQGQFSESGISNAALEIDEATLLKNIKKVQKRQRLQETFALNRNHGIPINLDIEMETGTGKTYCYTKTIFELNKRYGWTKFIIIVPSVAIREGVFHSIKSTGEHFLAEYGKRLSTFIYNSNRLNQLRNFESSNDLTVMIVNSQAFTSQSAKNRKIYGTPDDFQSRRPIDIIAAARPILIMDEPQRLEGEATVKALPSFNPLMALRYSATHKTNHDKVYRLDAVDAFSQRIVKKIEAVGVEVKGLTGSDAYLFLEGIDISRSDPTARIDMEILNASGEVKRQVRRIRHGDNLFEKSKHLGAYQGFTVDGIDYRDGTVSFENGEVIYLHQATSDPTETGLRRLQIRQAIEAHIEKEQELFPQRIKVLSLFFIDSVVKYRDYDREDTKGEYARIFEEEYKEIASVWVSQLPEGSPYREYLESREAEGANRGYFSVDKGGHFIDPKKSEGSEDTVSDYDLILRDKERLLSFEEETRFIFSHSALREGWDNPNVFVICLLKPTEGISKKVIGSEIRRRQELGRGLRISVDQDGKRSDENYEEIHAINTLTVIANEGFNEYSEGLQKEFLATLSGRQREVNVAFLQGKDVTNEQGEERRLNRDDAKSIHEHLIKKDFIKKDYVTSRFTDCRANGTLPPFPEHLAAFSKSIYDLVATVLTEEQIPQAQDKRKRVRNPLNQDNYNSRAFKEIWSRINHKAIFKVSFDDSNLVKACIQKLDNELTVTRPQYVITRGEQNTGASPDDFASGTAFSSKKSQKVMGPQHDINQTYDLVYQVAQNTDLSRETIAAILEGMNQTTFERFQSNPEHFISQMSKIISSQKASLFVNAIEYSETDKSFDSSIFTDEVTRHAFTKYTEKRKKHIYENVIADSKLEHDLAKDMDEDDRVIVYAKMPSGFFIPTPFGKYNPDWAICFNRGSVKHIYFMAETKGSIDAADLRVKETAKIDCARKFFDVINTAIENDQVKFDVVTDFDNLMSKAGMI